MPFAERVALKLFRKKPVRSSTQTSLAASAAVPDSGFVFLHNLQGASAALDEFSGAVSTALEHIDLNDDSENSQVKAQLKLLEDATAEYSNSTTDACCELVDWTCDSSTAQLAVAAFKCAAAVYYADSKASDGNDPYDSPSGLVGMHRKPESPRIKFDELEYFYPSLGGASKAIGFWLAEPESKTPETKTFPALIIAVRGTEKFVDHFVNANGRPMAASDFFALRNHKAFDAFGKGFFAHSGFLSSAKTLLPRISNHLSTLIQEGRVEHVVFTGHSAGGGVAALLYLKFLLDLDPLYKKLKFSCFTFGAPPTLSADISEALNKEPSLSSRRGMNLAFVNEFDMVSRIDQSYFRSLIDLFRSVHGLDPVMGGEISRKGTKVDDSASEDTQYTLPPLDFDGKDNSLAFNRTDSLVWPLPNAEYHVHGELVLLRKEHNQQVKSKDGVIKELRALSIRTRDFEKLLYCGVKTHHRTNYNDRMGSILQGRFNYKNGWN